MHDTKEDLQGLLDVSGHRLTRCFRVTRSDGQVFRVTDHDAAISFPENWLDLAATDKVGGVQSYTPIDGWDSSNSRAEAAMKKNSIELRGAFGGAFVTSEDIMAGLWDSAVVDDFIIDWRYPFKGAFRWNKYRLTDFQLNGEIWVAQSVSATGELSRKSGKVYAKTCWHAFGDDMCGIDLNDAGVTEFKCTVSALNVAPEHNRSIDFADVAGTYAGAEAAISDFFKGGHVRWTSGNNKGLAYPIRKNYKDAVAASGMLYVVTKPTAAEYFEITNTEGLTWQFIWSATEATGATAGTNKSYVSNTGAYSNSHADAMLEAINAATALKVTAADVTDARELPTTATDFTHNTRYTKVTQDVAGGDGNTAMVENSAGVTVFDFGIDGMKIGYGEVGMTSRLLLQYPTRADIAISDTFTLFAGCDKTLDTCKDATLAGGVDNIANFGGFPFLVGTSRLVRTGA